MEHVPVCTKMIAEYMLPNGALGGPYNEQFSFEYKGIEFNLQIYDWVIRKIEITSENEVEYYYFRNIRGYIEKLLYVMEGAFLGLKKLSYFSESEDSQYLDSYAHNDEASRLSYYVSSKSLSISVGRLLHFSGNINKTIFERWIDLVNEMDVLLQIFLYTTSDNRMTVDVNCAFLIEMSESFADLIASNLGEKVKSDHLADKLKFVIEKYGLVIFREEIRNDMFINCLVNTRVNIMHIKRNKRLPFLDGKESMLYFWKFSLMYRTIILELLGLGDRYSEFLEKAMNALDNFEDVRMNLLERI